MKKFVSRETASVLTWLAIGLLVLFVLLDGVPW